MAAARSSSRRWLAAHRHDEIMKRLAVERAVSVAELAERFGISYETVRRDLKQLADRGRLTIVHGGAARREPPEPPFETRAQQNAAGKAAIGRRAASLVEDGMAILLDSGTTTLAVARALAGKRGLTVCTGSLAIAQLMCRSERTSVFMLGGSVDPTEEAAVGSEMLDPIAGFRIDLAFIGGAALSPDGEVTDYTRVGAQQRSRMIAAAARAFFVIDSDKFGRLSPCRIAGCKGAAGIIVDRKPPAGLVEAVAATSVRLIVSDE